MKILACEKDLGVRRWLMWGLEELGEKADDICIEFAESADDLLELVEIFRPDCILLEAESSAQDDQPLWERLRGHRESREIPILCYSASTKWRTVAVEASSLIDGFIPSPFDVTTLIKAADYAILTRQPRRGGSLRQSTVVRRPISLSVGSKLV